MNGCVDKSGLVNVDVIFFHSTFSKVPSKKNPQTFICSVEWISNLLVDEKEKVRIKVLNLN